MTSKLTGAMVEGRERLPNMRLCPGCGYDLDLAVVKSEANYVVECKGCGVRSCLSDTVVGALYSWNNIKWYTVSK